MKANSVLVLVLFLLTVSISGCTQPAQTTPDETEENVLPEAEPVIEKTNATEKTEEALPAQQQTVEKVATAPKSNKLADERLKDAYAKLHTPGSGEKLRRDFPDLELLYTDTAYNVGFPDYILPFRYYYSKEVDKTFNICAIETSVFICDGKLSKLISKEDIDSGRCKATEIYLTDRRLGGDGSGEWN